MEQAQQGSQEGEQKVCPYFSKGTCRMGTTCKWLHLGEAPAQPAVDEEQQQAQGGQQQTCPFFAKGKCTYGNQCKWSHPGTQNQEPCPYFAKGKCYYGPMCKFKHIGIIPDQYAAYNPSYVAHNPMAFSHMQIQALQQLAGLPQGLPQGMNMPPPYAMPPGYAYPYEPSGGYAVAMPPPPRLEHTKVCRYWQQGNCPYDNCKYIHQGAAGAGPSAESLKRPGAFQQDEQSTKRAKIENQIPSMGAGNGVPFPHVQYPQMPSAQPGQPTYGYAYGY